MDGNADAQQAKALPAPGDESGLPVDETREDVGLLVASSSGPPAAERIPKATSQPLAKASTPYLCILFTLGTVCVLFLTWIIVAVWKGLAWGGEVTIVGPVTSSPTEDRSFAYIALPNGLQAFLVSDPDAVSAGIAVDVKVGSLYDPPEYAGLAHGVEHLLFQGTQKFPGEDEYNQYLAKNGGSSNAYTDSEDTNYHLSVANHALEGAMDRFSQFFISPIFNESSLMRELNAVNSEHLKNLQNQNWRSYQLVKHVSAEGKPFNSFSTGNMETLNKPGIRSAMLAFHARHYYASNMRLAVISQESIETMTSMVASKFASVPARPRTTLAALTATKLYQSVPKEELEKAIEAVANKSEIVTNTQASLSADVAYPPATHRGIIIETVPVTESHTLTILFPLPSQADSDSDRTGAVRFLSDLLGDEGSGSILSYLKNPSPNLSTDPAPFSLIESVSTGLEVDLKGFSMLSIQVHFSPAFIDRARAEVASKVGSNGGGNATAQATSGILTAASNRVAAAVFAYLQIVSDELEGAVQQSVQLLGTTGNEDRLCGAHRSLLIDAAALANQTKTDASTANQQPRFVAGALPLAATKTPPPPSAVLDHSVGSVNDDLGMCRARDGSLVSWPGNASSNAAFRVWSESQLMASLRFRYPLKGEADHAASGFARSAHRDGPLDILSPPSRSVWQPRLIHAVLQRFMKPENMIMLLSSSLFSSSKLLDSVEPIYNSRYRKTKIDTTKLAKSPTSLLDKQITVELPGGGDSFKFPALVEPFSKLHLPPTNPFLPKDFSLARHSGYATLLGLVDIDDVAASVNNDPKQRGLAPVKEQVLDPPHVPTRESSAALVEQLRSSDGLVNDATALRSSNEAGIAAAYKLKPMLLPLDDLLVPDTTAKHRSMALSVTEASPISAFWLPDAFFGRPKTFVVVELISPTVASSTPTNQILTALLINLVKEQLRETAYAANRGGASFSLSALSFGGGLALSVESYSQVTPALMEALIKPLASLAHTSSSSSSNVASEIAPRLVSDLTLMLHGLRNARKDQPYKRALYRLDLLLGARRYSAGQLAAALLSLASAEASSDGAVTLPTKAVSLGDSLLLSEEPLTVKDSGALANALLKHAKDLFADFASANIFIYGNENVQSARALAKTIVAEHLKPQHLLDELKQRHSRHCFCSESQQPGACSLTPSVRCSASSGCWH
jgi:secreted Zn-dependent insulinase-like peptidase